MLGIRIGIVSAEGRGAGPIGEACERAGVDFVHTAALIGGSGPIPGLSDVDLVVEAVAGARPADRGDVLALIERSSDSWVPIATTSSERLAGLATSLRNPARLLGLRVWPSGDRRARAAEITTTTATQPAARSVGLRLASALRLHGLVCADVEGRLCDRLCAVAADGEGLTGRSALIDEAIQMLAEGVAEAATIDRAALACGLLAPGETEGPLSQADRIGLGRLTPPAASAGAELIGRLLAQGRGGASTGEGFFVHPAPGSEPGPFGLVLSELHGGVAIAWLCGPPHNALGPELAADLGEAARQAREAGAVALLVASGIPGVFSAGADLPALAGAAGAPDATDSRVRRADAIREALAGLSADPLLTIAVVTGPALGAGCELALACDLRVAASSAVFGQPEVRLGLVPGLGGVASLARMAGRGAALSLAGTGGLVCAAEAHQLGIADFVSRDHEAFGRAGALARVFAAQSPAALAELKPLLADADGRGAARAFARLLAGPQAEEGINAFIERRPPDWRGGAAAGGTPPSAGSDQLPDSPESPPSAAGSE